MNPVLYLLFFASGALGLVYEVVWMRELSLVFGASAPAVATVLAVFLLGLAAGAFLFGRWIATRAINPWRVYATLEILIALCAWLFPSALRAVEPWFAAAYGSGALAVMRFAAALVLLLPPTVCLGGTLPVMARALDPLRDAFSRQLAWLYAANTGGAALGACLAPFLLLPKLGAAATLYGTPVLNIAVGIAALIVGRRWVADASAATARAEVPAADRKGLSRWLLLTLALMSGLVVIMLEVVVTRLLAIYLGQSTYGFGMMLTCFVLGLALGAWAVGGVLRFARSDGRALVPILAAASAMLVVMVMVMERVPFWLAHGALKVHQYQSPFPMFVLLQFGLALLALLPPTFALGMVFPVLLAGAGRSNRAASREIGLLYGVNTAGSVIAALLAGFVIVPAFGTHVAMVVTGVITVLAALLVIVSEVRGEARYAPVGVLCGLVALASLGALFVVGKPNPQVLLRSPWLYGRSPELLDLYEQEMQKDIRRVAFLENDAHGTVAVGEHLAATPRYRFFSVNGKVDGGGGDDMHTQVVLGSWPCLLFDGGRRDPENVLVIGLGTGTTAGAALSFAIKSLDVVEISPTMPRVAREFFADVNRKALDDPRTHVIIGDGRHHVAYSKKKYDVIVSEPSNPWISGIGFLFSQQTFELMRAALNDGGVMCQWLQVYDLGPEAVASVLKTFTSVFPCSFGMMAQQDPVDVLLIGFKRDLPADGKMLDYATVQQAFARHQVADEYRAFAPASADDLLRFFLIGPEGSKAFTTNTNAVVNTDGNAFLEFEAPKMLATDVEESSMFRVFGTFFEPASRYVSLPKDETQLLTNASLNTTLLWRLLLRVGFDPTPLLPATSGVQTRMEGAGLAAANAAQTELNDFLNLFGECSLVYRFAGMLSEFRPLEGQKEPMLLRYGPGFDPTQSREFFEKALKLEPDSLETALDLAMNYQYGKNGERYTAGWQPEKALALYREVLKQRPDHLDTNLKMITVMARGGDVAQAEKLAFETYRANQASAEAAATYGAVLQQSNKLGEARLVLESAVERDPSNIRSLRQLGAVYAKMGNKVRAEELLAQALKLNPNDPDTRSMVQQLKTAQ